MSDQRRTQSSEETSNESADFPLPKRSFDSDSSPRNSVFSLDSPSASPISKHFSFSGDSAFGGSPRESIRSLITDEFVHLTKESVVFMMDNLTFQNVLDIGNDIHQEIKQHTSCEELVSDAEFLSRHPELQKFLSKFDIAKSKDSTISEEDVYMMKLESLQMCLSIALLKEHENKIWQTQKYHLFPIDAIAILRRDSDVSTSENRFGPIQPYELMPDRVKPTAHELYLRAFLEPHSKITKENGFREPDVFDDWLEKYNRYIDDIKAELDPLKESAPMEDEEYILPKNSEAILPSSSTTKIPHTESDTEDEAIKIQTHLFFNDQKPFKREETDSDDEDIGIEIDMDEKPINRDKKTGNLKIPTSHTPLFETKQNASRKRRKLPATPDHSSKKKGNS